MHVSKKGKVCLGEYTFRRKNTHILRTSSKKYACTSKHLPGTVKNNVSWLHQAIVQFPLQNHGRNVPDTGRFIIQLKGYWFYSSSQQWWTVLRIKKKSRKKIEG